MSDYAQQTGPSWVEVGPDENLWKHLKAPHLRRDGTVNSSVYCFSKKPDPSISVDIAQMTNFQEVRARRGKVGVGQLVARVPLNMDLTIRHEPTIGPPAGDNDAHAVIESISELEHARMLADATECILHPDDDLL